MVSLSDRTGSPSSVAVMVTPLMVPDVPAGGARTSVAVPLLLSVNVAHEGRFDADSVIESPSASVADTATLVIIPDATVRLPMGVSTGAVFEATPVPDRLMLSGLLMPVC